MEAAQPESSSSAHPVVNQTTASDDQNKTSLKFLGTQQFVTFAIGKEEYAVDIMQVREIQAWTEVTALPKQPDYMRGVLNLRGIIVPIFDLRCRFSQGVTEATKIHVVVIVAVADHIIGILVDRVSDILAVESSEILPVPDVDDQTDGEHIIGLVTAENRMVALLDLGSLFKSEVTQDRLDEIEDAPNQPA